MYQGSHRISYHWWEQKLCSQFNMMGSNYYRTGQIYLSWLVTGFLLAPLKPVHCPVLMFCPCWWSPWCNSRSLLKLSWQLVGQISTLEVCLQVLYSSSLGILVYMILLTLEHSIVLSRTGIFVRAFLGLTPEPSLSPWEFSLMFFFGSGVSR